MKSIQILYPCKNYVYDMITYAYMESKPMQLNQMLNFLGNYFIFMISRVKKEKKITPSFEFLNK